MTRRVPAAAGAEDFFNRELSWLQFDERVLEEAVDSTVPPLERLKFVAIFGGNLDEFFMKRVGGLKLQLASGVAKVSPDGRTPAEQLAAIGAEVRRLYARQRDVLQGSVLPELARHGVELVGVAELTEAEREHVGRLFEASVFPILTPLGLDTSHPFPFISNLSLSLAVAVRSPSSAEVRFARVKVPASLPRWLPLPGAHRFVPLGQVIALHLERLFPGLELVESYAFRVTRAADVERNEEPADDLLESVQIELRERRFAPVVRLEVVPDMPAWMRSLLADELEVDAGDLYEVEAPLGTRDLMALASLPLPALREAPWRPVVPARLAPGPDGREADPFRAIAREDLLVHHPYDSFSGSVQRFIQVAAADPAVLAIKQTLYRTSRDSPVVEALIEAAERGKQVAVLIELQARFDEENNIRWAQRLEDVGVHVSYGVAGLKTHAKVMLVVRREGETMRRYVHLGTGNYHPRTARLYTDFGLFTTDPDFGADLTDLFNVLTGFGAPQEYRRLITAPRGMRERFAAMIQREADHARAGRPARILAKMNALVDAALIRALYEASQAGVTVDLIVRGICCLRPGIPGVSDRIRVISVIGRFLEHSRAFYFLNGGAEEVYIGSADWMPRNLDRRIEAVAPVLDPVHRAGIRDQLNLMWQDNRQAWELDADGHYTQRRPPSPDLELATHRALVESHRETGRTGEFPIPPR